MTDSTGAEGTRVVRNPYVVVGATIVAVTLLGLAVATNPFSAAVAQSLLPLFLGSMLIVYGVGNDNSVSRQRRSLLARWIAAGVATFTLVGVLFFVLSVLFETAYLLAVIGSLATGAVLGAVIGTYAIRLRRANEQLSTQNERLEEFAAIVSHDVRNPLNVASGMVELADGDDEKLDRAASALERIDRIIDDVLMLTRGTTDIEPTTLALDDVALQAWETVDAPEATLTIDGRHHFDGDRHLTRQLLENLFRNSVDHGDEDVTIRVGPTASDDRPADEPRGFYVADDGPGIPPEDREEIFETGYSGGDGTGLGLHVVQRICDVHGWTIAVDESRSGGARFEITATETSEQSPARPERVAQTH
jgi:signal transduction histidine kinase